MLSYVQLFATPLTVALQAPLSVAFTRQEYWSGLPFPLPEDLLHPGIKLTELVMPSNYLILCHPLLLLPSVFPSIRVFSNESVLRIRCLKYWSFSFSISSSNEYSGWISFRMDWLDPLQYKGLSRPFSNTTVQKHQFFGAQLSL